MIRKYSKYRPPKVLLNWKIPFDQFILIDEEGKNLGLISKVNALRIAENKKLDLYCINKNSENPICKILNYDRYRFLEQKKQKKIKRNKETSEKEIQLSATIADHDLEFKAKRCIKFLQQKSKVRLVMFLRGRQKYLPNYGIDKIKDFLTRIQDYGASTNEIKLKNNNYKIVIEPKK